MSKKYDHNQIEEKWLESWEKEGLFVGQAGSEKAQKNKSSKAQKHKSLDARDKMYLLFAFAYPSGSGLHVGHVESKTALDILARYYRMNGKDVFFPVGWDAFGLPAENYAIKTGVKPAETTQNAIDTFRRQIKRIGISYDWANELATSHPGYYKWTQWIFLQLYNKGLAYKKPGMVNWCPSCQTVLANEQVVDGHCERCDHEVIQKQLDQWYFKITEYKDELIEGLDQVDWPKATEEQQKHWIGRAKGLEIDFLVEDSEQKLTVWTKFWETVFGTTFVVIAPEKFNELGLMKLVSDKNKKGVEGYLEKAFKKTEEERKIGEKDKTGVDTGILVVNQVNGDKVPLYVADYVLANVGTAVVMGVPAHDERDYAFAKKFGLKVRQVVDIQSETHSIVIKRSVDDEFADKVRKAGWYVVDYEDWGYGIVVLKGDEKKYIELIQASLKQGPWYVHTDGVAKVVVFKDKVFEVNDEKQNDLAKDYARTIDIPEEQIDWDDIDNYMFCHEKGGLIVNSGKFDGLDAWTEGKEKMAKWMIKEGVGRWKTTYKLRDWLISRQRYWGAPIPIVYDPQGKPHPVKEEHLPWMLPEDVEFKPTGESPLKLSKALQARVEKLYGKGWTPEYDTMDTFVDSSWYFLRYPFVEAQKEILRQSGNKAVSRSAQDDKADLKSLSALSREEMEVLGWDRDWSQDEKLPFDKEVIKKWLPVDFYMIGPEHIVLHLLYARFWTKFLRDEGYLCEIQDSGFKIQDLPENVDPDDHSTHGGYWCMSEPFMKMRHQGMILGPDHKKMSKSKGNVIDPDKVIEEVGADALRMYEMFMGPIDADKPWNTRSVVGVKRFLDRVYRLVNDQVSSINDQKSINNQVTKKLHQTIKKVSEDIPNLKFNTAIASMMEFVNEWERGVKAQRYKGSKAQMLGIDEVGKLVRLLAPFAPFFAEELWDELKHKGTKAQKHKSFESVHLADWPQWDEELAKEDEVEIAVQVNGKLRSTLKVDAELAKNKDKVLEMAREDEKVQSWLVGKEIRKEIFVPGRLVNLVVG